MSGGGSQFNSPSTAAGRRTVQQSLRPVTIKQIHSATQAHTDAEWMLEDTEIGSITVVAQVMDSANQTTNSVYYLDDGTSRIEARHWVDSTNQDGENPKAIPDRSYVRVMGSIKTFGNKRYINASHLRLCKDPHEFYFHALECITSKLLLQKGSPSVSGDIKPQIMSTLPGVSLHRSHSVSTDQYSYLPPLERSIVTFMLNQPSSEDGIHVGAIARAVGGSAASISAALDKLMDEGHVFTTINESHYALSV